MKHGHHALPAVVWSPGSVRAVHPATGGRLAGSRLDELTPLLGRGRKVVIGVERSHVFLRVLTLPRAARADLRKIVGAQIATHFPMPPDEIVFDVVQSPGKGSEGCATLVAAMRVADLRELLSAAKSAGLVPLRILPASFGAAALAVAAGHHDAVVAEVTAAGLAVDVVRDGLPVLARLTVAGDDATEVRRTAAAAEADGLPVLCVGPVDVSGAEALEGHTVDLLPDAPLFDFVLPEERVRQETRGSAILARSAALAACVALALGVTAWRDRGAAMADAARVTAALSRETGRLRSASQSASNRSKQSATVQATLKDAFEPGQPISDLVNVVADSLPPEVWITGLSVERGKPIQVRGTAGTPTQVAGILDRLGGTPRVADARLVSANTSRIGMVPVVQFSVSAAAAGNPAMPTPPKKAAKPIRKAGQAAGSAGGAQ
ncbi:MAG: PilN domain-containing protein [Armatimonadetes bacterium]|nr:PilN domain-containing protein [Armatimonadota bacterium]